MRRTVSSSWPFGSSTGQSTYRTPGTYGHSSPQPSVTARSLLAIMSRVNAFGDSREVSRPRAARARATSGWICSPGSVPADSATTRSPA